jgi:hypothetical protein
MRRAYLLFLFLPVLNACLSAPAAEPTATAIPPREISPGENPYAPQADDLNLQRAGVTVTSVNLSERFDLTPRRAAVSILGYMPGVCNELRINVNPPDGQRRIFIEVYSLMDPSAACEGVFQQFEGNILLGTYTDGRYTVWVNGERVGDFAVY